MNYIAHILCIDDEPLIRETIGEYLIDEGFQVSLAGDGREGLELFHSEKPDLVIVDLRMPEVDGYGVIKDVSSADSEIPIIVISGVGEISAALEAIHLGAWDYITKPVSDMGIILMAISRGLEKSRLLMENRKYRTRLEELVRQRTDELNKSEERFRRLTENARDIIIRITLPEPVVEYVNPIIEEITGYPKEEFLNDFSLIYRIVPENQRDQLENFIAEAAEGSVPDSLEYMIENRGGSKRWILQRNVLVFEESKPVALEIIAGDITSRRKAEEEREELIRDLEAKNAELERFTYTVSHDLRSPLVTIKGFIGMLRDDIAEGDMENAAEDMERIDGAAERMHALLADLLELSRIGRVLNESIPAPLGEIIAAVRENLDAAIREKGALLTFEDNLPKVYGDVPRIEEVFQNLFENALKFTPDEKKPEIKITAVEKENFIEITVKDNGRGIEPKFHERIFGLFNKLDKQSEGSGVGLSLVKRIIEFHGGRIRLESSPGEGAAFIFTLPAGPATDK